MPEEDVDLLQKWLSFTQKIYSTLEIDEAVKIALAVALQLTGMERGFVMTFDPSGELYFQSGRNMKGNILEESDFAGCAVAVRKVREQREPFYFTGDPEGKLDSSTRNGFCIPLFSYRTNSESQKMVGVLYADSSEVIPFDHEEKEIVNVLAMHAGPALENALLYNIATRDPLTRLYQRHYFDSVALIEWRRTVRHKHPVSIVMLDLDGFKTFNDAYGWAEGDLALKRTANILREACRTDGIIARYDQENFEILLPETDTAGAKKVAQRILENVPLLLTKEEEHP